MPLQDFTILAKRAATDKTFKQRYAYTVNADMRAVFDKYSS